MNNELEYCIKLAAALTVTMPAGFAAIDSALCTALNDRTISTVSSITNTTMAVTSTTATMYVTTKRSTRPWFIMPDWNVMPANSTPMLQMMYDISSSLYRMF